MGIFTAIHMALSALLVHKGRSSLTSLGIVIGTAAVISMVSAAGGVAGQFLAFGNPFAAVAGSTTAPLAYEIRDRIKAGMPLFLGAVPGPGLFSTLTGGELAYRESLPKTLPPPSTPPLASRRKAKSTTFSPAPTVFVRANRSRPCFERLSKKGFRSPWPS